MNIDVFDKIEQLPSLPLIVEKLNGLLSDPRTTVDDVAKLMSSDQALVSRLLKLVNSAFYGLPGRISTIPHAIALLGFSTLKNLVISVSVLGWQKPQSGSLLKMQDFWLHSAGVGAVARVIARHTKMADPDEAFVAGLLHDIGRVAFQTVCADQYASVLEASHTLKHTLFELENKAFGLTHADVGAKLVTKWKLPDLYREATQHHHSPQNSVGTMSWIIHLADPIAKGLNAGSSGSNWIGAIHEGTQGVLHLNTQDLQLICKQSVSEIEKASILISIF